MGLFFEACSIKENKQNEVKMLNLFERNFKEIITNTN